MRQFKRYICGRHIALLLSIIVILALGLGWYLATPRPLVEHPDAAFVIYVEWPETQESSEADSDEVISLLERYNTTGLLRRMNGYQMDDYTVILVFQDGDTIKQLLLNQDEGTVNTGRDSWLRQVTQPEQLLEELEELLKE